MEKKRVSDLTLSSKVYKLDLIEGIAYIETFNVKSIITEQFGGRITVKGHNPKNNNITFISFDSLDSETSIYGDTVAYYFVYEDSWKIAELLTGNILAKIDQEIINLRDKRNKHVNVKSLSLKK